MINWNTIVGATGWTRIAETLLTAARDAARDHDVRAMQRVSADLLAFVQHRNSECPQAVADAVFHGQNELTLAIAATSVAEISAATAQLNASLTDVQRASTALDQQARLIELQPVLDTLHAVDNLLQDALRIQQKIADNNPQDIDVSSLERDIKHLIDQLTRIAGDLKTVTGQVG